MRRGGVGGLQVQHLVLAAAVRIAKGSSVTAKLGCRSAAGRVLHSYLRGDGAAQRDALRCALLPLAQPSTPISRVEGPGSVPGGRLPTHTGLASREEASRRGERHQIQRQA